MTRAYYNELKFLVHLLIHGLQIHCPANKTTKRGFLVI